MSAASPYHQTEARIAEEWQMIQAAQADPRRFAPLYERYYREVYLFVFKRIGDKNDTADVVAQTFVKVLQNLPKYQFRGMPFSSWLYRIALNEVNQFFRVDQKRSLCVSIDQEGAREIADEIEEAADPDALRKMYAAMQKLNQEEIQMIQMRYFDKIPFREVAEILSITEVNAKVRMHRVLQKLKKHMS